MLRLDKLCFAIQNEMIVNSISFEANFGEIIGLIGPNGAGKTTIMRLMAGVLLPSAGDIFYNDIDFIKNSNELKKTIGYLPEGAPLYGDMSAKEYLEFIAKVHGFEGDKLREIVKNIAIKTNIESVFHQKIDTLSKGFRRRIAFAASAIHSPQFLVLDEPMDGLDPNQKELANNAILELAKTSNIFVSTHVLEDIEAICTRIILINNGKIIIDESKNAFLKRNSGNFREAFKQLTRGELIE